MKRILFAVSNDLVHDRRMQRICASLQAAGWDCTLIGRAYGDSPPLREEAFRQSRMRLWFRRGKLFYLELNWRLWWAAWRSDADVFCGVDLDTLLPLTLVGRLRGRKVVYDAHEYFTETPELLGRPLAKWVWNLVALTCIPRVDLAYTVGPALAAELAARYGRAFEVIRNVPTARKTEGRLPSLSHRVLWYHGALNVGRGLETLIESLEALSEYRLLLAGEGDLSEDLRRRAEAKGLSGRVTFLGWVRPEELPDKMAEASIGFNLLVGSSRSYYFSLANKAFDYIQAALPAVYMDFPEYRALEGEGRPGVAIAALKPEEVAAAVRQLEDSERYLACQTYLEKIRGEFTWEKERSKLIPLYNSLIQP
jgi:glycosyltransferase involved in cell wall biosynthesis